MSGYAIAHLDEIDELDDGRQPWRPVRHHFGISSFGITAWTGREAGDRILNEHDEADQTDGRGALPRVAWVAPYSSSTASAATPRRAPSSSSSPR